MDRTTSRALVEWAVVLVALALLGFIVWVLWQIIKYQRLAAFIPRPRLHLIRFHGVLAPTQSYALRSSPVELTKRQTPPMGPANPSLLPRGPA